MIQLLIPNEIPNIFLSIISTEICYYSLRVLLDDDFEFEYSFLQNLSINSKNSSKSTENNQFK